MLENRSPRNEQLESLNSLQQLAEHKDMLLSQKEHIKQFLNRFNPQDTVWVFDFDGTLIHKWFSSFSPIDNAEADTENELLRMKEYMLCIEGASNYEELTNNLQENNVQLPPDLQAKVDSQPFDKFQAEQLNYWWQYTMEKAVERELPMTAFDLSGLTFRPWAKKLLNTLLDQNDQVLIITSGVGNVVRHAMKEAGYDLDHPYLHIKGNDFKVNNKGRAETFDPDLITPYTKMHVDYHKYGINDKAFAIQAGDSLGDAQMITDHFDNQDIVSIGFSNEKPEKNRKFSDFFDIVCKERDSSFAPIQSTFLS